MKPRIYRIIASALLMIVGFGVRSAQGYGDFTHPVSGIAGDDAAFMRFEPIDPLAKNTVAAAINNAVKQHEEQQMQEKEKKIRREVLQRYRDKRAAKAKQVELKPLEGSVDSKKFPSSAQPSPERLAQDAAGESLLINPTQQDTIERGAVYRTPMGVTPEPSAERREKDRAGESWLVGPVPVNSAEQTTGQDTTASLKDYEQACKRSAQLANKPWATQVSTPAQRAMFKTQCAEAASMAQNVETPRLLAQAIALAKADPLPAVAVGVGAVAAAYIAYAYTWPKVKPAVTKVAARVKAAAYGAMNRVRGWFGKKPVQKKGVAPKNVAAQRKPAPRRQTARRITARRSVQRVIRKQQVIRKKVSSVMSTVSPRRAVIVCPR